MEKNQISFDTKNVNSTGIMLKISLIGILFLSFFGFDDGVIVKDNTPAHMKPGQSVEVKIEITKAQIQSFGKLLIDIPQGFTAEVVESQGASFTFASNKAKFIWMALPQGENFSVKYNLIAGESTTGSHPISGVFSYIKNNQRVDYRLTDKIIVVSNEDVVADTPPINNTAEEESTTAETANAINETTANIPDVNGITCFRSFERITPDRYMVTLRVIRSGYIGFAKISDMFSIDYGVSEGESDGAVTIAAQGKIKYVWFEVPEVDEFYVTYFLDSETFANSAPEVTGKLSIVENGDPKDLPILNLDAEEVLADNTKSLTTPAEEVIEETTAVIETTQTVETIIEDPEEVEEEITETVAEEVTPDLIAEEVPKVIEETVEEETTVAVVEEEPSIEEEEPSISNIPNPETGVTYKVQILAAHTTIGRSYFKKRHKYSENFNIEHHEGWIKYTTGQHTEYKQARNSRERINNNYVLPGPFVTAYNDGERITVQEALMISKQQWYQ